MATWTDIPDEVLEPGKPIRSVDALALRDNPIAIAEGASGAPRIQTNAIANSAVTNPKIASMASSKLTGTIPGSLIPATEGAVGTYALLVRGPGNSPTMSPGSTIAGSQLRYANAAGELHITSPSGTWRCMGQVTTTGTAATTLFVRIS